MACASCDQGSHEGAKGQPGWVWDACKKPSQGLPEGERLRVERAWQVGHVGRVLAGAQDVPAALETG